MDLFDKLNDMQKQAVLTTEGPLLLLAGAGSGKTRVVTHRIAYLIEKGVRPFNILAITFTNKAAREMKERAEAISTLASDVWISTFHSTCVRILRREIHYIGFSNQFTIYDSDDSERLIKDIIKNLELNDKMFKPKSVLACISDEKNKYHTCDDMEKTTGGDIFLEGACRIYRIYQKRLRENNCLDFDDLLFMTVKLFLEYPEVLIKYQNRFRYIMVDEYQDTNNLQYMFVNLLAKKNRNLCVVGDDDQSIYGWRGANIQNILDFEKDYPGAKVIKLEQNYRSTQNILDAANAVIRNNMGRKDKALWTESRTGQKIKYCLCESDIEESYYIANEIKKGVSEGKKYSDYAILYRNNALSRSVEDKLVKGSIPYRLFGGVRFYDRKEIKDIVSYLKFIYNPSDNMALKRVINTPKRGIGSTSIDKLEKYSNENEISMFEGLLNINEIPELKGRKNKFLDFLGFIKEMIDISESESVFDLIKEIYEKSGYKQELIAENTDEAKNRMENIDQLLGKALEFQNKNNEGTLAEFLEEVALVADVDNYTEDMDTVVLMTLHSSKGLEFPTVFISGMEDGIFPGFRAMFDEDGLEEERRLMYVGITRAKEVLYLTGARSRFRNGEYEYNAPSKFIKEIPDTLVELPFGQIKEQKREYVPEVIEKPYNPYKEYIKKEEPKIKVDYNVGDKVMQMKYGIGIITEVSPAGADYELTIDFGKNGIKKLMANLSKPKKM